MRQLPAASHTGATSTTEHSRSRSQLGNETKGATTLSNGSIKEPIVTRSKSRLRVGRRFSGRSPKKPESPLKINDAHSEGSPRRKPERGTGNSSNHSSSSSSPKTEDNTSEPHTEKMYARHYKSYRRINGIKSRRGERSSTENHSHAVRKEIAENSVRDCRRNIARQSVSRTNLRRQKTRNHVNQNGTSTPPRKDSRPPNSRVRQLALKRKKQLTKRKSNDGNSSVSSSSQSSPKDEDMSQKDKVAKRRSALWVLNCEAESFLFGETAADKHEVELPPLAPPSPPPKKRRKWRVNELGHLLEKSPILETKLRKSSSSESGSDMHREASPPKKRLKPDAQRAPRRVKNMKRREKTPDMCSTSSKTVKSRNHEQVLSPKPELLSPIPFLYSPDSVDHEAKTVQFQKMLANVDWRFSFEKSPVHEIWYPAFIRTENSIVPHSSFLNPLHEPLVLPYEMDKPIRRSRSKPVRNSRKSPRCHASTLAILSSERPTRSTRSSVNLDSSPSSSVNNLQPESTLPTLLLSPTPNLQSPSTSSSSVSRFFPPKCIPPPRRRHPSSPKPSKNDLRKELGAAQYLWDSIQLLSDSYVVSLLAGDDPDAAPDVSEHSKSKGIAKNHRCNNNNYVINNCPVKHFVKNFETSSRKASLRSGDVSATSTSTSVNSINLNNSRLVAIPKSSPRNHCHGTNHCSGHNVSSPPVSPSAAVSDRVNMNGVTRRFTSRSPPLSPPTKQAVCSVAKLSPKNPKGTNAKQSKSSKGSCLEGDNGLISHEKSSKKSPIVLVTDIYSATTKTKISSWDEESLFIGDGLPPLPSWHV